MLILFAVTIFIITYHIVLYPLIIAILAKMNHKSRTELTLNSYPSVTVLCAAYNEEKNIEKKIQSFLSIDYPKDRIKMIIISDSSTDRTDEIVRQYVCENLELIVQNPRKGKQSAHNMIRKSLNCDYVLSTDANAFFQKDSVKKLIHIIESDPKIGMVSGESRLVKNGELDSGEGLYWRYECALKKNEARIYSTICGTGALFIIRRDLFTEIASSSPDDYERALIVLKNRYKVDYCADAYVTEDVSEKTLDEFSRKIRIVTQEWQAMARNAVLLNPFKHPVDSLILMSHKIIRWLVGFVYLLSLISATAQADNPLCMAYLIINILVLIPGSLGLMAEKNNRQIKALKLFSYWTAMNIISIIAVFNALNNRKYSTWKQNR